MKWIILCVLCCSTLCQAALRADLNGDCRVDMGDLAILMSEWMESEDCMSLGPELIVNGTFDADLSGWTNTGEDNFTYQGNAVDEGNAVFDGTDGSGQGKLEQTFPTPITAGKTLRVSIDIVEYEGNELPDGENFVQFLNAAGQVVKQVEISIAGFGTTTEDILTSDEFGEYVKIQVYIETGNPGACAIDNVSVKEVITDNTGVTMSEEFMQEMWMF